MIAMNKLMWRTAVVLGLVLSAVGATRAEGTIGTAFPADFPVILDASLGIPVIGFGGAGPAQRTPVIFLHGNGGTPYDNTSTCAILGANIRGMAQHFADNGYALSELWALGYQGNQCVVDPVSGFMVPPYNSSLAHTHTANVQDLRRFVKAVLASTGARKVDIVAHGMGVTLAREWVRQDGAQKLVRRFIAIEGPNSGMIICSAHPQNPWQSPFAGGFTPDSPLCQELGSPNTAFLKILNKTAHRISPSNTLVIRNGDVSFLFMPVADGLRAPVPSPVVDSYGAPADFSLSARIKGAAEVILYNQNTWDYLGGTAHVGIANSPDTWGEALAYLTRP